MLQLFTPASKCLTARVAPGSELKRSIWIRSWAWHHIRLSGKDVSVGEKKILGWIMVIPRGKNSKKAHICPLPSQHLEYPGRGFPKDTDPLPSLNSAVSRWWVFHCCRGHWSPGLLLQSDPLIYDLSSSMTWASPGTPAVLSPLSLMIWPLPCPLILGVLPLPP